MDTLLRSRDPIEARKAQARMGNAPHFHNFLALHPVDRKGSRWQNFFRLNFGACFLSIQASETHYCEPRETGLPVADYVRWEFAIMVNEDMPPPGCITPFVREYDGVETRTGYCSMPEFDTAWSGDEVAAYQPTALVQGVFRRLWIEFGNPTIF